MTSFATGKLGPSSADHSIMDIESKSSQGHGPTESTEPVLERDEDGATGPLPPPYYRVYRRRWLGVLGLFLLNIAAGMNWLWFSPVSLQGMFPSSWLWDCAYEYSNAVAETFHMTLTQVNWLNNTVNIVYIPVSFLVPPLSKRYGIRITVREMWRVALVYCTYLAQHKVHRCFLDHGPRWMAPLRRNCSLALSQRNLRAVVLRPILHGSCSTMVPDSCSALL